MNLADGLSVSARHNHIQSSLSSEGEEETKTPNGWKYYPIVNQFVFNTGRTSFAHYSGPPPGPQRESNRTEARTLQAQSLAAYLAEEFNRHLRSLPGFSERSTPKISFLKCSILILSDPDTVAILVNHKNIRSMPRGIFFSTDPQLLTDTKDSEFQTGKGVFVR
jgi:hypothetical protein